MKTLFKGGLVVSGKGTRRADILVDGEKVIQLQRHIDCVGAKVVDVSGKLLFPGFIDGHTHFDLDVCNTTTADDFASGSRAALRGGTTTILDFACPEPGEGLRDGLARWQKKATGNTACDYSFHMTLRDWNNGVRQELPAMFAAGVSSFKLYMAYAGLQMGDGAVYEALSTLRSMGGICGVHCENGAVIDTLIARRKATGAVTPAAHPLTRPDILEAEAVSRLLRVAQLAEAPVIVVHLSSAAGLQEVERARKRGQTVYVETCPHYLLLDDSVYFDADHSKAARFVCAPPLRKEKDRQQLWKAIRHGQIQTVATDHCSFTLAQKETGLDDFTRIPGGLPGVETRGELLYTQGVGEHNISAGELCALLSENPAKLYGLFPRKGVLQPGSDADIVVYDPKANHLLRAADMVGAAGYTPYEGMPTKGSIQQVWLRGRLVVNQGAVTTEVLGQYIARGRNRLEP